jgi:hypothetical protein
MEGIEEVIIIIMPCINSNKHQRRIQDGKKNNITTETWWATA